MKGSVFLSLLGGYIYSWQGKGALTLTYVNDFYFNI